MSRTPTSGIDYTSRDYEGFRQAMLAELGVKMPEYTDRSQTDAGIVILELNAKGLDILSYYADIIANETLLPTCKRRDSTRAWCTILSYTPRMATPSRSITTQNRTPQTLIRFIRYLFRCSSTKAEI